jgi:hypothetical protein
MIDAEQRFMAFEGLVQWTCAVLVQAGRIEEAHRGITSDDNSNDGRFAAQRAQTEAHLFAIAAGQVLAHKRWLEKLGAAEGIDFAPLSVFAYQDIVDLRNMREHVVEYFQGGGKTQERWIVEAEEFRADASAIVETKIGGRLDWVEFARAAENIREQLLQLPIPFPPAPEPRSSSPS